MSKSYEKKKNYRRNLRKLAKDGYMNDASGRMVARNHCKDDSMKRDYSPQR